MKGAVKRKMRLSEDRATLCICTFVVFSAQLSLNSASNVAMIMGYVIALAWAFFCNAQMLMAMILFFLPDNSILDIGGISIQLIIMCVYLFRFSILKKRSQHGNTFLAGLAISAYSLIYLRGGLEDVLQGLKLAIMILFLTEYFCETKTLCKENYEKQLSFAVLGMLISVIMAIVLNPAARLATRFALSEDSNWNMMGILSALLFAHCFVTCFIAKRRLKYIVYSVLMMTCALLSTSRTAMLVIACGAVWTLLFIDKRGKRVFKAFIVAAIVVFLILLVNGTIRISYVDTLVDRIVNPRRGDISNGRFTLWARYIDYLLSHIGILLFGCGSTLIEGITTATSTTSTMAHNMLIEQITMYGIIGSIIVIMLYKFSISSISRHFYRNRRVSRQRIKFSITILLVFLAGMFSHVITSVLVTLELYIGLMQYYVLSSDAS